MENAELSKVPALRTIYYNPTSLCNLACSHCWLSPEKATEQKLSDEGGLTLSEFESVLDQGLPLGLTGIKYTGGEPFLKPGLEHLLTAAHQRGLRQWFETNLTILPPGLAKTLAQIRPTMISTSLDHCVASRHDKLRGRKGAFDQTIANAKLVRAMDLPLQVVFTLTRDNVQALEGMYDLAAQLGAESLKINILQPVGRGKSLASNTGAFAIDELLEVKNRLARLSSGSPAVFLDLPPALLSPEELQLGGHGRCAILNIIGLLADGSLSLCGVGTMVDELRFGNVRKDRLEQVWASQPGLLSLRANVPGSLRGICKACLFLRNCLGACRAEAYYRDGDLGAPHWLCEEAAQNGYFPESRKLTKGTISKDHEHEE